MKLYNDDSAGLLEAFMRTKELIRSIATRTTLSHDEVEQVLEAIKQIVIEQLEYSESVVLARMMKISGQYNKSSKTWGVKVAPYMELKKAVGRKFKPINRAASGTSCKSATPPDNPHQRAP